MNLYKAWAVATDCPIEVGQTNVAYSASILCQAALPANIKEGAILLITGSAEVTNDSGVNVGVGRLLMIGVDSPPENVELPTDSIFIRVPMVDDLDPTRHHMVMNVAAMWKVPTPNPFEDSGAFVSFIVYCQTDVTPTSLQTLTINAAEMEVVVL